MSHTPYQRHCHDCGSSSLETPFPGAHKPYKQLDRCTDRAAEVERLAEPRGELVDSVVAPQ